MMHLFTQRIDAGIRYLDRLLEEDGHIYGVTTGYGDSCTIGVPLSLVDEILFSLKPHCGQQQVAARIQADLNHHLHPRNSDRLQDRYSIRCAACYWRFAGLFTLVSAAYRKRIMVYLQTYPPQRENVNFSTMALRLFKLAALPGSPRLLSSPCLPASFLDQPSAITRTK